MLLVQHLPRLNEGCFIVSEIHLEFDSMGVFHNRSHRCVNHSAVQVGLDLVAYLNWDCEFVVCIHLF
jgi:hypothetical protein